MQTCLYVAKDTVANTVIDWFCAPTDGAAIRSGVPIFSKVRPIDDVSFYRVAVLDGDTGLIVTVLSEPVLVSRDAYRFPEVPSTPIKGAPSEVIQKFDDTVADLRDNDLRADVSTPTANGQDY